MGRGAAIELIIGDICVAKLVEDQSEIIRIGLKNEIRLKSHTAPRTAPYTVCFILVDPVHFESFETVGTDLGELWQISDSPIDQGVAIGQTLHISHVKGIEAGYCQTKVAVLLVGSTTYSTARDSEGLC